MASRNGLNPKIRGPKGVGFGRALPAPFGFGNGIDPNGTGYLNIPALERSVPFPIEFTIEWWVDASINYLPPNFTASIFSINDTINSKFLQSDNFNGSVQGSASSASGYIYTGGSSIPPDARVHIVLTHQLNSLPTVGATQIFLNGSLSTTGNSLLSLPFNINRFLILAKAIGEADHNQPWRCKTDEVRVYRKILSPAEIALNYNNHLGNNPSNTEHLLAWYQFERFENLDFSSLQDGSDIRVGIRDMSGNNNHGQQNGFNTDPLSDTYVLKPF